MNIPEFIFIAVLMVAFGYLAGNAKSFNFWKLALLAVFLIPFIIDFNLGKAHLWIMLVSFVVGFLLPYASALEEFADAINPIRYIKMLMRILNAFKKLRKHINGWE